MLGKAGASTRAPITFGGGEFLKVSEELVKAVESASGYRISTERKNSMSIRD